MPEQSPVTGGRWNAVSLADNVSMAQGNYYWIAYIGDTTGVARNLSAESGTSGLSVTVSENLTGLNPGTYTDNITITAAGAINSPLVVLMTSAVNHA